MQYGERLLDTLLGWPVQDAARRLGAPQWHGECQDGSASIELLVGEALSLSTSDLYAWSRDPLYPLLARSSVLLVDDLPWTTSTDVERRGWSCLDDNPRGIGCETDC
jgi:hypothetical protein